jgi:replicative DNA helicase
MSRKQTTARLDTLKGHFSNVHISSGNLYNKDEYREFLNQFGDQSETPYIIKTMEDLDQGLSVAAIEADLAANPAIRFVTLDGFNLMSHKGQDGNRNNMANTSRRLRQLFARYGVVGLVVHQTPTTARKAQLSDTDEAEDGFPVAPKLTDYSETVAVIQDAVTVLTFGYNDGLGKLAVRKARKPCVDFETNLHVNFNMGYIREVELGAVTGDTAIF